jgi:hypothetical protein
MTIRTFQVGDDVAQVSIYNEVAASFPKFKIATVDEVRRRCTAPDFDSTTRLYALVENRPVAYINYQLNGRVSFPWCRKGQEAFAEPLLEHALAAMKTRGIANVFAAYRGDWPIVRDFFLAHGFQQSREMINYVIDLVDLPTPAARASSGITPLTPADLPTVMQLGKGVLRVKNEAELHDHLFRNPYFPPNAAVALRSKANDQPVAVGIVVAKAGYAPPKQLDANMPCFRLGAFGTEGMTTKRVNGLFSLLAADNKDVKLYALDLMSYATNAIYDTELETFAAQVSSDAAHLVRFYNSLFRRQGSFPIYERQI